MNWIDYWTLILQIVLACIILTLPVSLFLLMVAAAVRKNTTKTVKFL